MSHFCKYAGTGRSETVRPGRQASFCHKKTLVLVQGQAYACGTTLVNAKCILSAECHHTLCPLRRHRVSATKLQLLPIRINACMIHSQIENRCTFHLALGGPFTETAFTPDSTVPDSLKNRFSVLLPRLRFRINMLLYYHLFFCVSSTNLLTGFCLQSP